MAAHMTRLCCRALTLNAVYKRVKLKSFLTNDALSSQTAWQPRLCFGTRGRHTMQDVHIHIPVDRLKVSYSKSSGPGGQHVNKVSTRAEVRFHVHTADWIPEDVRQRIFEKNKNSINKAGELMVTSELSRSQQRNLSDCIQKISTIIAKASQKPHEPSAEDIALRTDRLERRKNEQLKQKKIHSLIKRSRRVDFD